MKYLQQQTQTGPKPLAVQATIQELDGIALQGLTIHIHPCGIGISADGYGDREIVFLSRWQGKLICQAWENPEEADTHDPSHEVQFQEEPCY